MFFGFFPIYQLIYIGRLIMEKKNKKKQRSKRQVTKNVSKQVIQKEFSYKEVMKFFCLRKTLLITYFIVILYVGAFVLYVLKHINIDIIAKNMDIFVVLLLLASLLGSTVLTVMDLIIHPEIINSLCYKVVEKCQIREQYQRYLEIKECIETHNNSKGECDLETNIAVIEAAIEHDQAHSIVVPIFITATTAIFFENEQISVLSVGGSFLAILMILLIMALVKQIPRNAFIKKVVEKIKEENCKK